MTSGYTKFRDVRFFGSLDGLRAIAITIWLGVLLAQAQHSKRVFDILYTALGSKWSAPVLLVALLLCNHGTGRSMRGS
jgi:hypothetical protein